MDVLQKVKILGEAANYDTVCGSPRSTGIGNKSLVDTISSFVHKSRSENYDCKILKVLQTNKCLHDCKYCTNRCGKQKNLTEFEPIELAKTFNHTLKTGLANALFLSSGVAQDADKTTEQMLKTVRLVRHKFRFQGYIHFKILPGTSKELVKQAAETCSRLSINIEAPSKSRLSEISSNKDFQIDIQKRQRWIKEFKPNWGQTTQLIVGSQNETDMEILKSADYELKEFELRRFYFSAFSPVKDTPFEDKKSASLLRENFLYRSEFLLRQYGFKLNEFFFDKNENLPLNKDPKLLMALNNDELFPLDINEAPYEELIRIPGIGPLSANRIILLQNSKKMIKNKRQLKEIRVRINSALPFIKLDGKIQLSLNQKKW